MSARHFVRRNAVHVLRVAGAQHRWCSSATEGKKSGLGQHFGADHEQKESLLLKSFVAVGSAVESLTNVVTSSSVGGWIAPKSQQVHTWGKVEKPTFDVERDDEGVATVKKKHEDLSVKGIPIDNETLAVVPVGTVQDHIPSDSAWGLFKSLLFSKRYRTTHQQATDALYQIVPDFSEVEFLEDIESKLLPAFLEAFWAKDVEALKSMCSEACYHIHIEPQMKQYEKLRSNCRMLMTRRANLFQRLMFIDDSDWAPSVRRRAELSEKGLDLDEINDLDDDEEKPEAVFFVSCSAHIENEWVDAQGEVKMGDRHRPEDWYFVFGLTPRPGPSWTLSSLEFTQMQAMG